SRRRHTRSKRDWSSDVCSSDLGWCPVRLRSATTARSDLDRDSLSGSRPTKELHMVWARRVLVLTAAALLMLGGAASATAEPPTVSPATTPVEAPAESSLVDTHGLRVGDPGQCETPDLSDPGGGLISGFFTFYTTDLCEALSTMQDVYESGGDTLITF